MIKIALHAVIVLSLVAVGARAGEIDITRRLAPKYKAEAEVVLHDGSRVDLLSDEYAIEVDYPRKWAEACGQAVHYGLVADRKPAVLLLLTDPETEWQELVRAARVCGHLGIVLFVERLNKGRQSG